jgi:hypothetical protein
MLAAGMGYAMIRKYVPDDVSGAFGPDEIRVLSEALAESWQQVLATGAQFNSHEQLAREKLAKIIVELAANGDRDPKRLVEAALIRFRLCGRAATV